jgi:hypothetical protein
MRQDFLNSIQAYEARAAIPPSTLRGQPTGTIAATRGFLSVLPLEQFGISRSSLFYDRLDLATENLRLELPRDAQFWGLSRKALNIFLRNAFYNSYLNHRYRLYIAELLFEVPLDSITAKRLYDRAQPRELPRWQGVMHLRAEQNQLYQEVARRVARVERIAPVHLDAYWWGGDREGDIKQ